LTPWQELQLRRDRVQAIHDFHHTRVSLLVAETRYHVESIDSLNWS
jgi:hypothetical protein